MRLGREAGPYRRVGSCARIYFFPKGNRKLSSNLKQRNEVFNLHSEKDGSSYTVKNRLEEDKRGARG